ncbi:MAG: DNA mismatch repair protein MutS, partial [Gemmatimonadetes bacterium]|nr:DNA mismatch repair protein MutS [Gemmatimonadota bacterium]
LDEILSGTNSRERHAGTVAVLKRLVTGPTATLVSTHDLSLAALADDPTVDARVVHFTDAVMDGQMTFDYRLREGPLPSTNALEVMRLEGIEVDEEG